jgi:tetratricopeptide (TPR) repeat protein
MDDKQVQELVLQYEKMKGENKSVYFEAEQIIEIANAYSDEKEDGKALSVIDYGLTFHPNSTELLIEKAYIYIDKDQMGEAEVILNSITETYSRDFKMLKAELLLKTDRLNEANEIFDSLEDKEEIETVLEISDLYIEKDYIKEALSLLEPMVEKVQPETNQKDYDDFASSLINCYVSSGQYDLAAKWCNKLLDVHPYQVECWLTLSTIYTNMKEYSKALEAADFALAIEPENQDAKIRRSICLKLMGELEESSTLFNEVLNELPLPKEYTYSLAGTMFLETGQWKEAYNEYSKALEISVIEDRFLLCELYKNAVYCLTKMESYNEAYELAQKGKQIFPDEIDLDVSLGIIYLQRGEEEKAWKQWNFNPTEKPELKTLVDAKFEIGLHCFKAEKYEWAKILFTEIKELDPQFEDIEQYLACAYLMLKDVVNFDKHNNLADEPLKISDIYSILGYEEKDDKSDITSLINSILDNLNRKIQ